MTVQDLVAVYGNKANAARTTGYARCTLTLWDKAGGIPYETQCRLHYDFKALRRFKPSRDHVAPNLKKVG